MEKMEQEDYSTALKAYMENKKDVTLTNTFKDISPEGKIRFTNLLVEFILVERRSNNFVKEILNPTWPDGRDYKPFVRLSSEYGNVHPDVWTDTVLRSQTSITLNADCFLRVVRMYPKLRDEIIPRLIEGCCVDQNTNSTFGPEFIEVKSTTPTEELVISQYPHVGGELRLYITNLSPNLVSNYWMQLIYASTKSGRTSYGSVKFTLQTLASWHLHLNGFNAIVSDVTESVKAITDK